MSCWKSPIRELKTLVIAPIHKHSIKTVELYSIKGEALINKYTPAVTIVAACIKADTGVGYLLIFNIYWLKIHSYLHNWSDYIYIYICLYNLFKLFMYVFTLFNSLFVKCFFTDTNLYILYQLKYIMDFLVFKGYVLK